jgi:hypothetical protein
VMGATLVSNGLVPSAPGLVTVISGPPAGGGPGQVVGT